MLALRGLGVLLYERKQRKDKGLSVDISNEMACLYHRLDTSELRMNLSGSFGKKK